MIQGGLWFGRHSRTERGLRTGSRRAGVLAAVLAVGGLTAACSPEVLPFADPVPAPAIVIAVREGDPTSAVMAELYAGVLRRAGAPLGGTVTVPAGASATAALADGPGTLMGLAVAEIIGENLDVVAEDELRPEPLAEDPEQDRSADASAVAERAVQVASAAVPETLAVGDPALATLGPYIGRPQGAADARPSCARPVPTGASVAVAASLGGELARYCPVSQLTTLVPDAAATAGADAAAGAERVFLTAADIAEYAVGTSAQWEFFPAQEIGFPAGNIVPLYASASLSPEQLTALGRIAGELDTETLVRLVGLAAHPQALTAAIDEWFTTRGW